MCRMRGAFPTALPPLWRFRPGTASRRTGLSATRSSTIVSRSAWLCAKRSAFAKLRSIGDKLLPCSFCRASVRPGRDGQGVEMSDDEVDFSLLVRREFPTRFFAKGNTIFREGEQGDEFFVVVGGEVEIRSGNRWFETVGQNGIFGEMALLDESPRSATAVALTDVTVVPIQEQQFLFMVKHTPFFALRVMRVLANRLRRQNKAA